VGYQTNVSNVPKRISFVAHGDTRRIVAIIQARMGSERLPGKVLARIGNSSLLTILIHRLRQSKYLDEIVVATTTKTIDDVIVELAKHEGVRWYRGSDQDVLDRYREAAKRLDADVIVRVTADNPLTDPELTDRLIEAHLKDKWDYSYCPDAPLGTAAEIIDHGALDTASRAASSWSEKEHVTLYFRLHPDDFAVQTIKSKIKAGIRLTVDTAADLTLMNALDEMLGPLQDVNIKNVVELVKNNPELSEINKHVRQKDTNDRTC
jgi:spore coat polysaccharide biosynthesis protein SpsF